MKETLPKLRNKLVSLFHKYIRLRDAPGGWGNCISCGKNKPIEELQAGHYIPAGSCLYLRFDERNVNGQCSGCNVFKSGNLTRYADGLIKKWGDDVHKELLRDQYISIKRNKSWYKEKIQEYKEKLLTFQD